MKTVKFFSVLLLTLLTVSELSAQNKYKAYCTLNLFHQWGGGYEAMVDLGMKKSDRIGRYEEIGEENGGKRVFCSPMAVLNYMSKLGWDIEYKVTNADSVLHQSYMMSKFVENDGQITEGLFLVAPSGRKRNQEGTKD